MSRFLIDADEARDRDLGLSRGVVVLVGLYLVVFAAIAFLVLVLATKP